MVSGDAHMIEALRKLEITQTRKAKVAIKEAQALFIDTLKSQDIPFDPETVTHIRSSITQGSVVDKAGEYEAKVGYGNDVGWRVHFTDTGTSKQPARKFSEQARNAATPKILELYSQVLKLGGD